MTERLEHHGALLNLGAAEAARRLRGREISSAELIGAFLDRIAAVNPQVNAIRLVLADEPAVARPRPTGASPPARPRGLSTGCRSASRRTSTSPVPRRRRL